MNFTKELINPKTCWCRRNQPLREADDRDEVIQKVQDNTQIKINILSGEQEAQWALRSVAEARPLPGPFWLQIWEAGVWN